MGIDRCALCLLDRDLQNSHIIPNAVFRRIKQRHSGGQLISVEEAWSSPIQYSQDTWSEPLLCLACEGLINRSETYGLGMLRGDRKPQIDRHGKGVTFLQHDYGRFKLFLTSLLWRAAVARSPTFSKIVLPASCLEEARQSLLDEQPLPPLRLGCMIKRLNDKTPVEAGGFPEFVLENYIQAPFQHPRRGSTIAKVVFVMAGFMFEFYVPSIPYRLLRKPGLHLTSPDFLVPYQNILGVPELRLMIVIAYGKSELGISKIG